VPVPLPVDRLNDGILTLSELAAGRCDDDAARVLFELVDGSQSDGDLFVDVAAIERSELWSPSNS
jgi:hypothetical protein